LQDVGGWGTRLIAADGQGVEYHVAGLTITEIAAGVPVILLGGL